MRRKPLSNDIDLLSKKAKKTNVLIKDSNDATEEARKVLMDTKSNASEEDLILAKYKIRLQLIEAVQKTQKHLKTVRKIVDEALSHKSSEMGSPTRVGVFRRASAAYLIPYELPSESRQRTALINTLSSKFYWGPSRLNVFNRGPVAERTNWGAFLYFWKNLPLWKPGHEYDSPAFHHNEIPQLSLALSRSIKAAAEEENLPLKLISKVKEYQAEKNMGIRKDLLEEIKSLCLYCSPLQEDNNGNSALALARAQDDNSLAEVLEKALPTLQSHFKAI